MFRRFVLVASLTALVAGLLAPVASAGVVTFESVSVEPSSASPGEPVSLLVRFTDSDAAATHVATVDWGDGSVEMMAVTEASGVGTASASHTYPYSGTFNVAITVDDGTSATPVGAFLTAVGPDCTIIGTAGNDVLVGTAGDDVICGLDGDDTIDGKLGADVIRGGLGDDDLAGNEDNDTIYGDAGNDIIGGGKGDDNLYGGDGADIIEGKTGSDTIYGGAGDDDLAGNEDPDQLHGGPGDDTLGGGKQDDVLVGGEGVDAADGKAGVDSCQAESKIRCEQAVPGLGISSTNPADGGTVALVSGESLTVGIALPRPVSPLVFERGTTVTGNVSGVIQPIAVMWDDASQMMTLELDGSLPDTLVTVATSDIVYDELDQPLTGGFVFSFRITGNAVVIASTSPQAGVLGVSPDRGVQITFSGPIDASSVAAGSVTATSDGVPVSGSIEVDRTGRRMFFQPDSAWPAGATIEIIVDGDQVADLAGTAVDADNDGIPGGSAVVEFGVLDAQFDPGTSVYGWIYDAYAQDINGGDVPIEGVTVRVDGFPTLDAVTGPDGYFEIFDAPSGDFFVHIDGSTAVGVPTGSAYPVVGKVFHSLPGQSVQLNMGDEPFDVYLPLVTDDDFTATAPGTATSLQLSASSVSRIESVLPGVTADQLAAVEVSIPADAAVDTAGNPVALAGVVPVPPDRLPGPLPPGVGDDLVISVQAPGAIRFDEPASVTFPNLQGLRPGDKTSLLSFNHDAGDWEYRGSATVSADGLTVTTDPGVGILAPGWHTFRGLLLRIGTSSSAVGSPSNVCDNASYIELLNERDHPQVSYDNQIPYEGEFQFMIDASDDDWDPPVVYDEYSIEFVVPDDVAFDQEQFLRDLATDFNGTIDSATFSYLTEFRRQSTLPAALGDVYEIEIRPVPDDAWMVSTGFQIGLADPWFKTSTISVDGFLPGTRNEHPVWGSRMWGIESIEQGRHKLYTRSTERPNNALVQEGEFLRKWTWRAMMQGATERFTEMGFEVGPRFDTSFSEPNLPPCYLPPPGRTVPPASPLPPYSGNEIHFLVQYLPNVFADRIERRFTIDPGVSGLYFPRDVLLPPGSAYVVYGYDPGNDLWGIATGESGQTGVVEVIVDLIHPGGLDSDGDFVSDIGEYISPIPAANPDPCEGCE